MASLSRTLSVLIAAVALSSPVFAQPAGNAADSDSSGRVAPEGPYRSRMRIVEDADPVPQPDSADAALQQIEGDGYARALLLKRLGYVDADRGDYVSAARHFEQVLQGGALDAVAQAQIRENLGALYAASGNYELAARALTPLLEGEHEPSASILTAAAYAYAQLQRDADALAAIDRAIRGDAEPPLSSLELKAYAERRLQRFDAAAVTLARLTARVPEHRDYWLQRAAMLQAATRNALALAVLLTADALGLLSDGDAQLQLARASMDGGMAYDAARRMRAGIEAGAIADTAEHRRLEADAWLLAREYAAATEPLRSAAQKSRDPQLYLRLGDIERELGRLDSAAAAFEAAARAGGNTTGRAWLALGEVRFRNGDRAGARRAFQHAAGFGGAYRSAADWLDYLGEPVEPVEQQPAVAAAATAGSDQFALPASGNGRSDTSAAKIVTAMIDAPPAAQIPTKIAPATRLYVASRTVSDKTLGKEATRLGRQLRAAVRRQRIAVDGPVHLFIDGVGDGDTALDLSVGVPVRGAAPPSGPFNARRYEAFTCAYRIFEGPLQELPTAWRVFIADVAGAGLPTTGSGRQIVLTRGGENSPGRVEMQIGLKPEALVD